MPAGRRPPTGREALLGRVKRLRDAGDSATAIAARLGIPRRSVFSILRWWVMQDPPKTLIGQEGAPGRHSVDPERGPAVCCDQCGQAVPLRLGSCRECCPGAWVGA
ncbi:MAG: hypothetical protein E6J14_08180 [Chloroflexi bacterium]|nr:MAG: hypothetical protein E6J14_08180 [Chloroflexota bacterium]